MEQLGQDDPHSGRNILWATLIMAVIFIAWAYFMSTPPANVPAEAKPAEKAAVASKPEGKEPVEAGAPVLPGGGQPVADSTARTYTVSNGDLELQVTNRGALLGQVLLLKYKEKGGKASDLVSPLSAATGSLPLAIQTGDKAYDELVNSALFHVEQRERKGGGASLEMSWSDGKGDAVEKKLDLPPSGYAVDFAVKAFKGGRPMDPVPLVWGPGFGRLLASEAKNRYYQQEYVGVSEGGSFEKIVRGKVSAEKGTAVDEVGGKGPIAWAAITDNYFGAIFAPDSPMPWAKVETQWLTPEERKVHPTDSDISLVVGFPGRGKLYLIPKEWHLLSGMGDHFYKLTDWGILGPFCAVLLWGLNKLYALSGNYGIAILLLTLVIKVAFYPLTQRSMVKMKEMGEGMKRLKPQIDRIKSKYKKLPKDMGNRTKMNEEMMALYQREGINPLSGMGGCLPMLLQMPVFFALFELLPRAIELRGAPFFGWIHDLSSPDPYYIAPIIMGLSMVVSTRMTATQGMEGPQKLMLWFLPIMFTWFCLWAPAGLTLYWLANNLLTMGQQAIINRQVAQRKEAVAKARKSTPKGPSKPSHA